VLRRALLSVLFCAVAWANVAQAAPKPVVVGSKAFTESVILAEIATQALRGNGVNARHRAQLGGTRVLWNALLSGEIDAYPEYTGTLRHELLAGSDVNTLSSLRATLAAHGLRMSAPLGFNNTYALGMRRELAQQLEIRSISDLVAHPTLRLGFSNEFMDRADGWPGLKARYALPQRNVRGLDHDLAYRGIESGALQVIDLYSTDAEIEYYDLYVLKDDRSYFPDYRAVVLYRADLKQRAPQAVAALDRLEGAIDDGAMRAMNARVKIGGESESQVAAEFVVKHFAVDASATDTGVLRRLWRNTLDHLALVAISLFAAVACAVPLGVVAARSPRLGQVVLALTGVIQTIPSLALLVFMIPVFGIGGPPAVMALFLYSLLPVVRNTVAGLQDIPPALHDSAEALGLPGSARLRLVELPMASRAILAGIKTSAVINVGTATLGALIGAGGYGQPILTGIRLDDMGLILQGAVPAAVLALLVQGLFELAERALVPRGLRLASAR